MAFERIKPMTDAFKRTTDIVNFSVKGDFDKYPSEPIMDEAANFLGKSYIKIAEESMAKKEQNQE